MDYFQNFRVAIRDFISGSFVSFLLFFLSAHFGCIFYEEYDPFLNSLISGKLTPASGNVMPLFALEHVGTTYVYDFLYRWVPSVEWVSYANEFFVILSGGIVCVILGALIKKEGTKTLVFKLLALWLFIGSHLLFSNLTRDSFLLCGTALLLLVLVYRSGADPYTRKIYRWLTALFFLLGVLTRPEPPLIVLLLVGPFAIIMLNKWKDIIAVFMLPVLIVGVLLTAVAIDRENSTEFYKLAEPDLEYQIRVQHNCVPLSEMKTEYDSVRYQAALGGLWSDPRHISIPFLRSILNKDRSLNRVVEQCKELLPLVIPVVNRHIPLIILATFMAIIFLVISVKHLPLKVSLLWGSLYVLFWLLIFTQTYLSKINDRSFASLLSIYLLIEIIFYLVFLKDYTIGITRNVIISAAFLLSFIQAGWLIYEAKLFRDERKELQQNYAEVKAVAHGGILLLNGSSYLSVMLSFLPFQAFNYDGFERIYMNDIFDLSLIHPYKDFLSKECNCDVDDMSAFYRFLIKGDKKVYLLSSPGRMKLMTNYLQKVHQLKIVFEEVPGTYSKPEIVDVTQQIPGRPVLYQLKRE